MTKDPLPPLPLPGGGKLESLIKEKITDSGPITIAEYMSLCLTHPEFGYYMRRDPFGAKGDFITAPEISQVFGELIGLWLVTQWEKLGRPKATLAEFGPGRGTLMNDLLRATKKIPGFHEAVSVRLMEISPALKQKQWHTLAGKHPDIEWIDTPDALPAQPLLLVANEFLDALPIRQFQFISSPLAGEDKGGGWYERLIGLEDGQLKFVIASNAKQSSKLDCHVADAPRNDGDIIETCDDAVDITKTIAAHIAAHGGAALIVDYGYTGGSGGDTLQAMRGHQYFEILGKPGMADITAHVDFAAVKAAAESAGARVFGPAPQGKFLIKIGAGKRTEKLVAGASPEQGSLLISGLDRLASPDKMGELFKALAITSAAIEHAEGF